ncbi:MAG: TonB-dependent receptor domain-containing protein [Phenylobacterium sp.]
MQEVIVTGTRLPNADQTADSPIVTLAQESLAARGSLTLETVLNRLPQVVPSYSSAANNPDAAGASYVNLRGLGTSRNLVLLNGRRVVGADASSSVDLNTLPEALIDRVEIITGGASAVYGADAVAGVVNVIVNPHFDGLEGRARSLVSEHGDGREHELSVAAGHELSRGDLMAAVGWSRRDEIGKGDRPFSAQADSISSFLPGGAYVPGPNTPTQAAVDAVFAGYGVAPGAVPTRGGLAGFGFNSDGSLIGTGLPSDPHDAQNYRGSLGQVAKAFYPDVYSYNYQPLNKLILPLNRISGALFGDVDLGRGATLYGQAMGVRYTSATALAATPAPTDANPLYPGQGIRAFTIPVTNPFIPADLARLLASRTRDSPALAGAGPTEDFQYRFRALALGPRQSDNRADNLNLLGGLKLTLRGDWRADLYASYGSYDRGQRQDGMLSVRRFEQLMYSPTGGTEFCDGGFNPFGGTMSSSCRKFLSVSEGYSTRVSQRDAAAIASGSLYTLPAGPVRAVVGFEHRVASYQFTPPAGVGIGEVAGFNFLDAESGSIHANDLFSEVAIPLLADRPLAQSVNLTLGYRLSREPHGKTSDSYKAEASWSLDPQLRLRGSFQRALRTPNILERYQAAAGGDAAGVDPCSNGAPQRSAQVLQLCRQQAAALGFDPSFADSFVQGDPSVATINRGNPNLDPERARTVTLGVVWAPAWRSDALADFRATLDGYDIRIDNAIGYLDPQEALNACYNIGGGNPTYNPASPACAAVPRNGLDFSLVGIDSPQSNQAFVATSGLDFALAFRTDLAAFAGRSWLGRLDTSVSISWLGRFQQRGSPLQPVVELAGATADATTGYESLPRWKGLLDLIWTSGAVKLDLAGRYIGPMEHRLHRLGLDPTATGPGETWYWDLSSVWTITRNAEFRAGVLNLFDRGPELFTPAVDASTDPSTYDVVGRRFWVGVNVRY